MKNKIAITILSLSALPLLANASSQSVKTTDYIKSADSSIEQGGEIMDGIGRNKDRLIEEKNKLYGTTSREINATPINPEILKLMREGKRGEELITAIKESISKLKDKTLNLSNDINASQEKLKKNLASKITDPKRIEIGLRISENFNSLNQKFTNKYLETLDKIESILNEISAKADAFEKEGKDVSNIRKAITEEKELIEISRLAVKTQAVKIYSVNVGSDASMKKDFGAVRQALQTDLEKVRETVKAAHLSLKNSANLLVL